MGDLLNLMSVFQSLLAEIASGQASASTYVIIAVIPICILVCVREVLCWFSKRNQLIYKVNRLEKQLVIISKIMDSMPDRIADALNKSTVNEATFKPNQLEKNSLNQTSKTSSAKPTGDTFINDSKFKL